MAAVLFESDSVIEVEPELKRQADEVLKQSGMSLSGTVNLLLRHVISRKKLPEDLKRPPIPCIDEMTEEELEALIQEGIDDVKAGRTYKLEEVRTIMEAGYAEI